MRPAAQAVHAQVVGAGTRSLAAAAAVAELAVRKGLKRGVVGAEAVRRSGRRDFAGEGRIVVVERDSLGGLVVAAAAIVVAEEDSRSLVVRRGRPEVGWVRRRSGGCRRGSRSVL